MTLSVTNKPVTDETLAACTLPLMRGDVVTLADARRKQRRHTRLYFDRDGRPFVRDRIHGRRYIVAVRFLVIDGKPLNHGCAVLEQPAG